MKISGFTLVEMLVSIAILAIVLLIGIPSFNSIIKSSNMRSNSGDFISALNYARMESVKRGTSVELDQTDGASWTEGLVVWVDDDEDGTMDSGEELRYWDTFSTGSSITSANSVTSFTFSADGGVDNNDTLKLCDDRTGETGRNITVLSSGAVYAMEVTCD
jgi:type IV fimbrial biogenesis protein FimT